jgi:DNA-directed RNA polymerase subunit L
MDCASEFTTSTGTRRVCLFHHLLTICPALAHRLLVMTVCFWFCAVTYKEDPEVVRFATFAIANEDHTLGNLLRVSLAGDRRVRFAGYRIQPQLENPLVITLRTRPGYQPLDVFLDHVRACHKQMQSIEQAFNTNALQFAAIQSASSDGTVNGTNTKRNAGSSAHQGIDGNAKKRAHGNMQQTVDIDVNDDQLTTPSKRRRSSATTTIEVTQPAALLGAA